MRILLPLFLSVLAFTISCSFVTAQPTLITNSPFKTKIKKEKKEPARIPIENLSEEIVFISTFEINGIRKFSVQLLNGATNKSQWLKINDSIGNYLIKGYSVAERLLIVEKNGVTDYLPPRERSQAIRKNSRPNSQRPRRPMIIPDKALPPPMRTPTHPVFPENIPQPPKRV